MNNVNANTNTDNEEIKYLTLDDIDKMYEESEPSDCGFLLGYHAVSVDRGYSLLQGDSILAKMHIREDMPADHAKLFLDFYNLFDENAPYKDKRGPYRDKLLNDLYFSIYEGDFRSDNGKGIYEYDINKTTTKTIYLGRGQHATINVTNKVGIGKMPVLDKNQKIEKLKKSFDIFKRLKERNLILASIYDGTTTDGSDAMTYKDYYGDINTHLILLNERKLLDYIRYFFAKVNFRAAFFIKDKFPNVKVTENMMAQYLEYKGR